MLEILHVENENILAFRASGKLTDADYQQYVPVLENLIREKRPVSLYVELENFHGWEARALWDDLRFGLQHDRDFDRIAIVGDKPWEHAGIAMANFFMRSNMRFFSKEETKSAREWLMEKPHKQELQRPVEPYRNILLPTDFSLHSERAASRAKEMVGLYGARLQVLHFVEQVVFYSEDYDPVLADIALNDDTLIENAELNMRKFAERTGLDGNAALEVRWGNPKWSIVSWAREKNMDLIVIGSHGLHGFERLLGSVSSSVLHQAPCDVVVVKES